MRFQIITPRFIVKTTMAFLFLLTSIVEMKASLIYWTGDAGNNLWADPDNWTSGEVPGPDDDVTIVGSEVNITDNVSIHKLILEGDGDDVGIHSSNGSTINLFNFDFNCIDGNVNIHDITMNIAGGTSYFSGDTKFLINCQIHSSGVINWNGGDISMENTTWDNDGIVSVYSGADILCPSNGVINNLADGIFSFTSTQSSNIFTAFHNFGEISTDGSCQTDFYGIFSNIGINSNEGDLNLNNYNGGGLFFKNAIATFSQGTTITGDGLIGFDGSDIAIDGTNIDFGSSMINITVDFYNNTYAYGTTAQSSFIIGKMNWYAAAFNVPFTIKYNGTLNLMPFTTAGGRNITGCTVTNNGTCNWLGNDVKFYDGIFKNKGIFNVAYPVGQSFKFRPVGGSFGGNFINCGSFLLQSEAIFEIPLNGCDGTPNWPYELKGSGILSLSTPFEPAGTWIVLNAPPEQLTINPSIASGTTYEMKINGSEANKVVCNGNINLSNGLLRLSFNIADDGTYPIFESTNGNVVGFNSMNALYSVNGGSFTTTPPSNLSFVITSSSISAKLSDDPPAPRVCTFINTGDWSNHSNWIQGFDPNPEDEVIILSGKTAFIDFDAGNVILNEKLVLNGIINCGGGLTLGVDIDLSYNGAGKLEFGELTILNSNYTLNVPIFHIDKLTGPGVIKITDGSLISGHFNDLQKNIAISSGVTVSIQEIIIRNASSIVNNGTFNSSNGIVLYSAGATFINNGTANHGSVSIAQDITCQFINNGTAVIGIIGGSSYPNNFYYFINNGTCHVGELGASTQNSGNLWITPPIGAFGDTYLTARILNLAVGSIILNYNIIYPLWATEAIINDGIFTFNGYNLKFSGPFQNNGTFNGNGHFSIESGGVFKNEGVLSGLNSFQVLSGGLFEQKNMDVNSLTKNCNNLGNVHFFPNTKGDAFISNGGFLDLDAGVSISRLVAAYDKDIRLLNGLIHFDSLWLSRNAKLTAPVLPSSASCEISEHFELATYGQIVHNTYILVNTHVLSTCTFEILRGGGHINAELLNDAPITHCEMGFNSDELMTINGTFINNGTFFLKAYCQSGNCTLECNFSGTGLFSNNGTIKPDPALPSFLPNFLLDFINSSSGKIISDNTYMRFEGEFTNFGEINLNHGGIFFDNHDVHFESTTVLTPITSNLGGDLDFKNASLGLGCLVPPGNNNTWTFTNTNIINNNGTFNNNKFVELSDYFDTDVAMTIEEDGYLLIAASATDLYFNNHLTNKGITIWGAGTIHKTGTGFSGQIQNFGEFRCHGTHSMIGENAGAVFLNCGDLKAIGTTSFEIPMSECPDMNLMPKVFGNGTLNFDANYSLRSILSPGNSPGTLTLDPGLTAPPTMEILAEIIVDQTDLIAVNGPISLGGTLKVHFENPTVGTYTIISGTAVTGDFANVFYQVGMGPFTATPPSGVSLIFDATTVKVLVATALPIELVSIIGKKVSEANQLLWQTASETNTHHFDIERAPTADSSFEKIGETPAAGQSTEPKNYEYLDRQPSPESFYRLKMVDNDGSFEYSQVVFVKRDGRQPLLVFPNPVLADELTFHFDAPEGDLSLSVFDVLGKLVFSEKTESTGGPQTKKIDLDRIPQGAYQLEMRAGQFRETAAFIKN